jgi:hypothetical protein
VSWHEVASQAGDPIPFTFTGATVTGGRVELGYRMADRWELTEVVELPFDLPDTAEVAAAVRVLHLVAGVSYYKCVAPVPLAVGELLPAEAALARALYDEGLREFAYRNALAVPLPVDLVVADGMLGSGPASAGGDAGPGTRSGALVPIGGGKDSALVAALVPHGTLFAVNPVGAHEHLARALGRDLLGARRTLDPQLRDLVAQGAPNGHVPVTAITSAISVLAATALGLHDVLMGIEQSADEPTVVTADGVAVNHQFSKSWAAEQLLRTAFAPTGVRYLSLLRPLSELGIGAAVARRGLAPHIVSCNRVFTVWSSTTESREQRPCGHCAKCLFTALMVAPSSSPEDVAEQYGSALLDDPDHIAGVQALWSDEKPFDCVGERLESAAAVVLLARTEGWRDQVVVAALADEAAGLLAAAAVDPVVYLELGALEVLPEDYRQVVASVAPDLAAVPGAVRAAT